MTERTASRSTPTHGTRAALPTIAVLPFSCIRHGTVCRDFGAGLAFAVTSALMRISGLHVISPTSTLEFCPPTNDIAGVAARLAARYVVYGHIVQADQVITVNIRLQDADKPVPLHSAPLDFHVGTLQDIQRGVVSRVLAGILPGLRHAEIERALAKAPNDVTAYEKLLQAVVCMHRLTRGDHEQAELLLKGVLAIDTGYADAYAWLARLYNIRVGQGWAVDRQQTCNEALQYAERAIALDPENALALAIAGHLNSYLLRRYEVGLDLMRRAVEACPNEPLAWLFYGTSLCYIGDGRKGRRLAEYALSLTPCDPFLYVYQSVVGLCCYLTDDHAAAVRQSRLSIMANPNYSTTYKVLAAALVALGEITEARKAGARLLQMEPNYPAIAETTLPMRAPEVRATFLTRMRTAGVLPPLERR